MDYLIYKLSALPADAADLQLLPRHEQESAVRRGNHYALIRTILRQELARRTGLSPSAINFTYGKHGKPYLHEQAFNISHSGDCLCLAFHHAEIGVDVERMRPRHFDSLADRFMCPAQFDAFRAGGSRIEDFYACWSAAEALIKHAGDTMWNARSYPFILQHGRINCLFDNAPLVQLFTPMPGYSGAVAYSL